jgi:hypothetical protein
MPSNIARLNQRKIIMHGLSQIHSNNAQAVINEHNKAKQNAIAEGHSVLITLDSLGNPDYTTKIVVFSTAASLKAHVLATIPVHAHKNYQFLYGRTA